MRAGEFRASRKHVNYLRTTSPFRAIAAATASAVPSTIDRMAAPAESRFSLSSDATNGTDREYP
jgi:hypothetical protein